MHPPHDHNDCLRNEAYANNLARGIQTNSQPDSIWQIRGYRSLFTSYSISVTGQWFDSIAIMVIFAYVWQSSPIYLGFIPFALALPQVLFSQLVAPLTRRFNKLRIMAFADILTACFTIGLFFSPHPWFALLFLALRSTVNVVHFPIQQELVRQLVPEPLRLKAVTWNGLVSQGAKIIVPFVGGLFLTIVAPQTLLLLNAVAFVISAFILFSIQHLFQDQMKKTLSPSTKPIFKELRAGWTTLFSHPVLVVLFSLLVVGLFCVQFVDSQFPILFRELAPTEPQRLTWVISAIGIGAVTIIFILNKFKQMNHFFAWISLAQALIAVAFIGFSFLQPSSPLFFFLGLGFICGIGTGISITTINYAIQTIPADEDVATIAGISQSLSSLVIIVAPLTGGFLTSILGVQVMFGLSGLFLIISMILPLFLNIKKTSKSPSHPQQIR
ncbi:MFS transporter [Shouchella sp. 1P09AA]|uniref:MFS transporter n=1 Tax=unclassified Shouchella TaxID=2893065 RepID=UPI00399EF6E4